MKNAERFILQFAGKRTIQSIYIGREGHLNRLFQLQMSFFEQDTNTASKKIDFKSVM